MTTSPDSRVARPWATPETPKCDLKSTPTNCRTCSDSLVVGVNAKSGRLVCAPCDKQAIRDRRDKDHAAKPVSMRRGFLYVLTHPLRPGYVKVGRAANTAQRLIGYNSGCPFREYAMAATVPTDNAQLAERTAHELLSGHHHSHEWFQCSVETASVALKAAA